MYLFPSNIEKLPNIILTVFCLSGLPEPIKAFLQMCVPEDMGEQTHTVFHASRQLSFAAGLRNYSALHFAKFRLTVQTEVITD